MKYKWPGNKSKVLLFTGMTGILIGLFLLIQYGSALHQNQKETERWQLMKLEASIVSEPIIESERLYETESLPESYATETPAAVESHETYTFTENPLLSLFRTNPDTVGWLQIADTRIDYPVVKGVDNAFYLNHGFDRSPNVAGAVFMDTRNIGDGSDWHTIIYGHRMKDGSMFRDLLKYEDPDFYDANRQFELQTLHGTLTWRVFASYTTSTDFHFIKTRFDEESYLSFLNNIRERSDAPWETEIQASDRILTLATCSTDFEDARFVVHAVLVETRP